MFIYRNPYGSVVVIKKDIEKKLYELIASIANKNVPDYPLMETLADFGLCPYIEDEGMLHPVISLDGDNEIINIVTASNAMILQYGQDKAIEIFLSSIKDKAKDFTEIDAKEFLDKYIKNHTVEDDINKLPGSVNKMEVPLKVSKENKPESNIYYELEDLKDFLKYKKQTKALYKYKGSYYLEPNENSILDDFLTRKSIHTAFAKVIYKQEEK